MASEVKQTDIKMNADNLYQEETFTDRRVGTIQRLTPVTPSGNRDDARPVVFLGQTQILTPAGALPLSFEVDADSLENAIEKFGDYCSDLRFHEVHNARKYGTIWVSQCPANAKMV